MCIRDRSTVELGRKLGCQVEDDPKSSFIEFSAQTRMSGVDLPDGTIIRKGAADAIEKYVTAQGGKIPAELRRRVDEVSSLGGTPLTVCEGSRILGVIYLKDTVKPGMVERFERLRAIGIKTIMCTGDNPLTAATIAKEAGVDGFIAECKPCCLLYTSSDLQPPAGPLPPSPVPSWTHPPLLQQRHPAGGAVWEYPGGQLL